MGYNEKPSSRTLDHLMDQLRAELNGYYECVDYINANDRGIGYTFAVNGASLSAERILAIGELLVKEQERWHDRLGYLPMYSNALQSARVGVFQRLAKALKKRQPKWEDVPTRERS